MGNEIFWPMKSLYNLANWKPTWWDGECETSQDVKDEAAYYYNKKGRRQGARRFLLGRYKQIAHTEDSHKAYV